MDKLLNHITCKVRISFRHFYFLIVLVFINLSFLSFPQNQDYKIEYITTKDGLANGCIQDILQDSNGFLWFATEGGLNRYDGYNIKLYDCGQAFIKTIFEDPVDSGKVIWIGTQGGLFKFDLQSEKFIKYQHNADDSNSISNNVIECIYKDRSGVYWIGTRAGGLNSFNPSTGDFFSYRMDLNDPTSISSDWVWSICEDYLDNLWVGLNGWGLEKFDRKTNEFIHYQYNWIDSSGLPAEGISSLYEDNEKRLWIGSWNLFKYDKVDDQFISPIVTKKYRSLFYNHMIWSMVEDKENTLWIGSLGEGGLIQISSDRNSAKHFSEELSTISASSICFDESGIIWVGTFCDGIIKIIPRKKYFNHYRHFITNSITKDIGWTLTFFEDKNDVLWIGIDGLMKFENGKLFHYPIIIDDTPVIISQILKSNNGKLWLICQGYFLEFDPKTRNYNNYGKYITYSDPLYRLLVKLTEDSTEVATINKVSNNKYLKKDFSIDRPTYVMVYCTGEGNLSELVDYGWITEGTDDKTVWKMNPGSSRNSYSSFKNRCEISFLKLKPGRYSLNYRTNERHAFQDWIGEASESPEFQKYHGINVFKIAPSVYQKYKNEIKKIDYYGISGIDLKNVVRDNEGRIWTALLEQENTFHFFDQETKQFIPYEIKINGQVIQNIVNTFKDHMGMLWLITRDNLLIRRDIEGKCEVKFDLKDFITNESETLNNNALREIYEDSEKNLWIGTDLGLFKYNLVSGKVNQYKFEDFRIPNQIEAIIEDNNGKLWITTSKKLIKFDPEQSVIQSYDGRDGLPNIKFAFNSCIKLNNGQIAFGGSQGFIIFDPDSIKNNEIPPEIAITGFQIFNKPIAVGEDSPLKKAITHSEEIVLDYDQDVFTFEFAALDFTDPERNKYAYKMEGVDPDWVYTDANRRFATYTNLDPGSYVFTVKGSNNDGIWNEVGKSILVVINPPWWATTWAYILYVILILSAIYFTWKLQLKRLRIKHDYEMSKFEAEKMHEVDEMKSRFFTNISHEFRTPLTLILGPAEKILSKSSDEGITREASFIRRNSNRLLQLVNQLLDLSKLDSGKLKLEATPGNIVTFIKGAALSFESLIESKDIRIKIKSSSDLIEVYFDREKMMKILSNLLSNAFKFTPERGKVSITIDELSDGTVEIKIRNTGVGIAKEELPKLFDRFYQVDSTHTKEYEGTGIGLALAKDLMELHHGSITVNSEVGKWTEFAINLPLGKNHLKDDEIVKAKETLDQIEVPIEEENLISKEIAATKTIKDEDPTTILVVEDNYDMREYIKESLINNYNVEEAVNGEQGVRIAADIIPDLIISDLMMPKMDGNELTRILKNDEKTSHIPIIILTAKSGQENKIEGLETGADDYLTKPFDLKELRVRVENLINTRKKLQEKFSKGEFLTKPTRKKLKSLDEKFLARIFEVIEKHISEEDFSIEDCGAEIGMSRTHLYKKVKALVGKSPSQYVRTVRLHRAKQMIEQEKGNVSEVAYSVGFSSPAYFSRCFKEEFGYPPKDLLS